MEFVTFEIAKKLKEKGFREKCFATYTPYSGTLKFNEINVDKRPRNYELDFTELYECYNYYEENNIDAPTISKVLKWLREEKKIFVAINIGYCYESYEKPFPTNPKMEPILKGYYYGVWDLGNLNDENGRSEYFESHELAAIAGIEYVLLNNLI